MKQREIEIIIMPDGNVQLRIQGYKGKSCLEAIAFFENVVGSRRELKYTSEYYEPDESVKYFIQHKNKS
ncbi:MAG: DUF2997 domain-containing protein [Verrucomicrobiia bacterium]